MYQDPEVGGLIVFMRLPELGKVKTRLAATLGNNSALSIYLQLTSMTLETAIQSGIPVFLFYEGGLPADTNKINSISYHVQSDGSLGLKMYNAISFVLSHHQKAVIIGSDCPDLSSDILLDSFARLEHCDVVIGPSVDGGYYLLGCKKVFPDLFHDIHWGTSTVLEQSLEKINALGLSCELLPYLSDIDTEEDWNQYVTSKGLPKDRGQD